MNWMIFMVFSELGFTNLARIRAIYIRSIHGFFFECKILQKLAPIENEISVFNEIIQQAFESIFIIEFKSSFAEAGNSHGGNHCVTCT